MLTPVKNQKLGNEGYIYVSYGHPKYLKHVIASVTTLRRYDRERPVAIVCTKKHKQLINKHGLNDFFDLVFDLSEEHASIVGFKHNFYNYLFFEHNLFLDSDIIWCKNPDPLWESFHPFDFTVTGTLVSDNFFGAPKGIGVIKDVLLRRRTRTLKRFNLTYLSRAQTGLMFASDYALTKKTCELAKEMFNRKAETHFQSRKKEKGRTEESCEWSLAMAMSKLNIPIYPWLQGHNSPQLDFIRMLTDHDDEFEYVSCKYYSHRFVYSLRGLKSDFLKKLLIGFFSLFPGNGDYMMVTPFCLHFGWYHEKQPFLNFSERIWDMVKSETPQREQVNRRNEAKGSRNES